MVLEVIYVVRHGHRSNWAVDPSTGHYNANVPSPTGIASDPALASYGVAQADQLGRYLTKLEPPVDLIYSSPFYRCLQTLSPFINTRASQNSKDQVIVTIEPGLGEFYGLARFEHPSPASIEELNRHFDHLRAEEQAIVVPSSNGESIPQLHDRVAYCLHELIKRADADPSGPKTLLICTHAAVMITLGRALTGRMPEDENEEDFKCFTCCFSKFARRQKPSGGLTSYDSRASSTIHGSDGAPRFNWRGGKGVGGGWNCEVNGDCSFLDGGEERGWHFSGDESFLNDPNAFNDDINNTADGTSTDNSASQGARNGEKNGRSRL